MNILKLTLFLNIAMLAACSSFNLQRDQVEEAKMLIKATPFIPSKYYDEVIDNEIAGEVEIGYEINIEGKTENFSVISSDLPEEFESEALKAARKNRYIPKKINGKLVSSLGHSVIYRFDCTKGCTRKEPEERKMEVILVDDEGNIIEY